MTKIIHPSYPTKLPSTGQLVTFRPFTVKEEKSLLLALQESSMESIILAIKNVILVCTDGQVDPDKVPYYDCEYLFLQIRSKSVGEVIEFMGSCLCSDKVKTEFSVDITELVVEPAPSGNKTFIIPDTDYTMEIGHPSIADFSKTFGTTDDNSTEVVANCIKSVYTADEVLNWSFKEKMEFVESMTPKQQKDISVFLEEMPMVKMKSQYTCIGCKKVHDVVVSGFESFFV